MKLPLHSRIGPSSGPLTWHCAGSVQAQDAAGRPPGGEAANRGTKLHTEAERLLRGGAPLRTAPPAVVAYVTEVQRLAARAGVAPLIEQRLDLSHYHPELFGTADAIIIDLAWGVLTVADFKSGFHHVAADALQLKLYGGMALMSLPAADQRKIKVVVTVVVQPNGGGEAVRSARHRVADIIQTLDRYVEAAWIATESADPPLTAGPWCKSHFCAARATCPAFRAFTAREAILEFTQIETADGGARSE